MTGQCFDWAIFAQGDTLYILSQVCSYQMRLEFMAMIGGVPRFLLCCHGVPPEMLHCYTYIICEDHAIRVHSAEAKCDRDIP